MLKLQGDERLVALIREGNENAFEVLFERYHSRLLAFCRHMLRSTEDAEDVLQEVFVKAHAAMLADERHINARPWLYRIARNRCLNHLRRPVPEGQDTMDVMPADGGVTTAERVQKREDFRALIDDVGELPETQRTALLLREIDALSYEDIATTMDTTVPAVKSLLVRARMSLAEASQSRLLTCGEVRLELAEAAEGLRKASGPVRQHLKRCEECGEFRSELRDSSKALAALAPLGPLALMHNVIVSKLSGLFGGTGSAAGGTAVAGGGVAAGGTAAAGGGVAAVSAGGAAT
ncbi:MAG TPA: RNA polymerase sigma factor, partial [Solirubrobacterales bacterium]|nr:RNA polymerase sigma factor [Solirubrobacterales bacterium]